MIDLNDARDIIKKLNEEELRHGRLSKDEYWKRYNARVYMDLRNKPKPALLNIKVEVLE